MIDLSNQAEKEAFITGLLLNGGAISTEAVDTNYLIEFNEINAPIVLVDSPSIIVTIDQNWLKRGLAKYTINSTEYDRYLTNVYVNGVDTPNLSLWGGIVCDSTKPATIQIVTATRGGLPCYSNTGQLLGPISTEIAKFLDMPLFPYEIAVEATGFGAYYQLRGSTAGFQCNVIKIDDVYSLDITIHYTAKRILSYPLSTFMRPFNRLESIAGYSAYGGGIPGTDYIRRVIVKSATTGTPIRII